MPMAKRILKIEVKRIEDTDPDTSYLGTFDRLPWSDFAINPETCKEDFGRFEWFNPQTIEPFNTDAKWISARTVDKEAFWRKVMLENATKDYERMKAFDRGEFGFIGIRVQAEIVVDSVCQTITSGGLWGIESDSDESYLKEVEQEELSSLRGILHEMGFSKRAIASAVKESDL